LPAKDTVLLGHGSGGKLSAELLRDVFLPAFANPVLGKLDDQAALEIQGARLAFTTDSFVVKPLFFRGGDIGSLAVHGTVNDLAMGGAHPLFLSAAFILEEGFSTSDLRRIVQSMADAAAKAAVSIVTGDTKVVEKGHGDGVYINTTGIGLLRDGVTLSADRARPGDAVILSGSLGDHGIAILSEREGLELETTVESDSAALHTLVDAMFAVSPRGVDDRLLSSANFPIRCMRDPTRGGLASTLNEIAAQSRVGITIDEKTLVIHDAVRGACELLGLDPLYVANEGKLVAIVAPDSAGAVLQAMRRHPLGRDAAIIGGVTAAHSGMVTMRTSFRTTRIVDMLAGDQLPRIC
jgi:hydrogenase expression/formation protein HypE